MTNKHPEYFFQTLFGSTKLNFDACNMDERSGNELIKPEIFISNGNRDITNEGAALLIQVFRVDCDALFEHVPCVNPSIKKTSNFIKELYKNSSGKNRRIFLAKADHKSGCFVPFIDHSSFSSLSKKKEIINKSQQVHLFASLPKPFEYYDYTEFGGAFWYDWTAIENNVDQLRPEHIWFDLRKCKPSDMPPIAMAVWPKQVWDSFVVPLNPFDLSIQSHRAFQSQISGEPRNVGIPFPAKTLSDEWLIQVAVHIFSENITPVLIETLKISTRRAIWKMCCNEIKKLFY